MNTQNDGVLGPNNACFTYADLVQMRVNVDDHRVILPPKSKATSDMESMIHHFKQVMEGPRPPIGEIPVSPLFDPTGRLFLAADDPAPGNREMTLKEREAYLRLGVLSVDEVRSELGLPPK